MTTPSTSEAVEIEVRVAAKPETIFPLLTRADQMQRWFGRAVELDPNPGGIYRVDINGRDLARGAFTTVEPGKRVVFTFGWEGDDKPVPSGSSTVEISLTPDGDGTIVRLRHIDLPEDARGEHRHGWDHYMERLVAVSEGRDPGPDSFAEDQEM
jgi:uncharacterized protein YndB with AHSA1/START domain